MYKKLLLLFFVIIFSYSVSAIQYNVTIYRDTYWVPHIYADSTEGLFFGFGYAQAQDHLIQIDDAVRHAKGTSSEVYGETKYNFPDKVTRLYKLYEKIEENYDNVNPETKNILESFVAGINYYINEHRSEIPERIQEYSGVDILAASYLSYYVQGHGEAKDSISKYLGKQLGSGPFSGSSNTWAIGSSKSSSGKAMLYGEPHVRIAEGVWWEKRWYEAHLNNPELNVMGVAVMGTPLIAIGFNEHIAWSQSNNAADVSDVYIEKINPDNPLQYEYDGQWMDMEQITETFSVLNTDTGQLEERQETFLYTIHGPIVYNLTEENIAFSARLTIDNQINLIEQIYNMNKATNLNEFKNAMSQLQIAKNNFMYADEDGHIFYVFNGRFPKINDLPNWQTSDWSSPVPGWTSETNWQNIHPFEDLPQLTDPENGFMQSCNSNPQYVTPEKIIDPDNYPSYMMPKGLWFGRRGARAFELLNNNGALVNFGYAKNVALNDVSIVATDLMTFQTVEYNGYKNIILYAYDKFKNQFEDPLLDDAISLIRNWNNRTNKESEAASLFNVFYITYEKYLTESPPKPEDMTNLQLRNVLSKFNESVHNFQDTYGSINVPWSDIHVYKRGDKLFNVGLYKSLHAMNAELNQGDNLYYVDSGPSYTFLVEFIKPKIRAVSMKPYGNTEDPSSVHFDDTTRLFADNTFKDAMLYLEDIQQNLDSEEPVIYLSYVVDGNETGNETQCGNGILESGEECDGNDFGGLGCTDFGYTGGNLICRPNCDIDISNCTFRQEPPPEPPNGNETGPPKELPKIIRDFLISNKETIYFSILGITIVGLIVLFIIKFKRKKIEKNNLNPRV